MKRLLFSALIALSAMAQTTPPAPIITTGTDAPNSGLCSQTTAGTIYVRSEDLAAGPIHVLRCTQTAPYAYGWQPIDHYVGTALPSHCVAGDVSFLSSNVAGTQLYLCSATDTWSAGGFGWLDDGTTITAATGRGITVGPVKILGANGLLEPVAITTSGFLVSGTYTSGISATGATGKTCILTISNGGGTLAKATVALTGTNAIAGSTALVVTVPGTGYTTAPTAATVTVGTATTCTGTAVIATAIGASPIVSGNYYQNTAGDFSYLLPTVTSGLVGLRMCFRNYATRTGVLTLQLPAATTMDIAGVLGTSAATLTSGGAAGDAVCAVATSTTRYVGTVETGTWTNN